MSNLRMFILFLLTSLFLVAAQAQHKGMNFQAVVKRTDGVKPTASGVTVTVQFLDPVTSCVLREEEHPGKNISNGYLNLVLGDSSVVTPMTRNPSPLLSISEVMDNKKSRTGLKCVDISNQIVATNQSYVPSDLDRRVVRLRFNVEGDEIVADFNMRSVGFAVNSEMLNSKTEQDFVNINSSKGVTQSNVESIFERFTKLDAILNGFNAGGTAAGINITGNASTATNVTGTVAIANGGTGATTAAGARTNLGLGTLATMSPTGTADNTTYLRGDGTWQVISGGGGGGPETDPNVKDYAKNDPGTGLEVVGNVLQVKAADVRTQATGTWGINVTGNAATATSATSFSGSLVGDVSGTQGATSVDKIKGRSLDNTAPVDGQALLWDNANSVWKAQYVRMQDVRNAWGGTEMIPASTCNSNQAMVWSVITDRFVCQDISNLNASFLSTGTVAPARLGTGTADNTTYLRGDGTWQTISASDTTKLPLAGGTMTGNINMGGQKITNIGNVPFVATNPAVGQDGQSLRWNNTSGQWEWFTAGAAGAGITSFNGQNNSAQSFSPSSSASSYGFSSVGGVHTLSIPSASTAGVTAGTISKSDYDNFNTKLGTATSFSGDVSGAYHATSVDSIKGKAITAPTVSGQYMVYDGTSWVNVTMSGDATMTAGGAVTLKNTGTAGSYSKVTTDAQGRVTAGSNLAASDIPALDWSKITTGTPTTLSGYGITDGATTASVSAKLNKAGDSMTGALTMNATNEVRFADSDSSNYVGLRSPATVSANKVWVLPAADGTANQVLKTDGAGNLGWVSAASGSVTSVTGTAPISVATGTSTPVISIATANTTTTGALSSTDWNTFNSKLGTATSFSGDVSGAYNATSVDSIKGKAVTAPTASGQYMVYNGTSWVNVTMSGDATMAAGGAVTLKNTGTAGTYAKVTTDAQGRVTSGVATLAASDIPALDWSKITTGKPTTLAGYGITDALSSSAYSADLTNAVTCAANQRPYWNTVSDAWACSAIGSLDVSAITAGTLPVARGGTGLSALGTANQVLGVNNAGTATEFKTITAGSGISVTHSANTITLSSTAAAGGSSGQLQFNNGGSLSGSASLVWDNINSRLGIGRASPVTPLDVNGTMRLAKNSSQPFACDATRDGAIAATSSYTVCICKNGVGWVLASNGQTNCNWSSTPANLVISVTTGNASAMDLTGLTQGTQAYGSDTVFTISNSGGTTSSPVTFNLSNTAYFEFNGGTCLAGITTLANGASCTILVRPKASDIATYSGNLIISSDNSPSLALLGKSSGFASGCTNVGDVCTGGAIFIGNLTPGSTSGSGTDRYMTTPGGCTDIPSGAVGGGTSSTNFWAYTDFTPASCSGTDSLTKSWNDGTNNLLDIPSLTNYSSAGGTGKGAINTDDKYGDQNSAEIVAITTAGYGGYHAAARYCDKLVYGGYDDWYLPNRYELNLMFTNKASIPGLSISGSYYWSSSEYDGSVAWPQRMNDGSQGFSTHQKWSSYLVRCVRRF